MSEAGVEGEQRRTGVVTGSTKGIGRAIGIRLARSGFNVVLNYSTDEVQAAEALRLCKEVSPHVLLVKADVSDRRAVGSLFTSAINAFGSVDVLVNNAARVIDKPALELTDQDWDDVVGTNMRGTFLCSQVASSHMVKQPRGGVILNIGASTGLRARKNGVNTCASKAAIMTMTQCFALELAPKVRVNTIIPGLVQTEETERRFQLGDPAVRSAREQAIPLGRIGSPEDVADAVMLLLSEEASFITGQKLTIDGGQNMW
jgi:3-oxoacyl-[acyl-carrier protein] reductase